MGQEMSAAAIKMLFAEVPDMDLRQTALLTKRFGIGSLHVMALEGCEQCFKVLGDVIMKAPHHEVSENVSRHTTPVSANFLCVFVPRGVC